MDCEGFRMAIDNLTKGQDEIKSDLKDIKSDVSEMKVTLGCTTTKVLVHDEDIKELKTKVNKPSEESQEIKYHGYFWFIKQWMKMKPLDKVITLFSIISLLLVIYFIPDLFKLIIGAFK